MKKFGDHSEVLYFPFIFFYLSNKILISAGKPVDATKKPVVVADESENILIEVEELGVEVSDPIANKKELLTTSIEVISKPRRQSSRLLKRK